MLSFTRGSFHMWLVKEVVKESDAVLRDDI